MEEIQTSSSAIVEDELMIEYYSLKVGAVVNYVTQCIFRSQYRSTYNSQANRT